LLPSALPRSTRRLASIRSRVASRSRARSRIAHTAYDSASGAHGTLNSLHRITDILPSPFCKTMNERPIRTAPLSRQDHLLRDKLIEDIAGQSARMDELARQIIALELAIPGIFATALKLVAGDKGTIAAGIWLYLTFACWALALALALISLVPRRYPVDMGRLFADEGDGALSIEGYFHRSALHKRRLLLPSCGLFFAGICCAAATVL